MSCKIINNGQRSQLYDYLVDTFGENEADLFYGQMLSQDFINGFGDYQTLIDLNIESIPDDMKDRVTTSLEPKIFEDDLGYFYLDKNYSPQYLTTKSSELSQYFDNPAEIDSLIQILTNSFINKSGLNLDLDNLDLNVKKESINLESFIKDEIGLIANSLFEVDDDAEAIARSFSLESLQEDDKGINEIKSKMKQFLELKKLKVVEEVTSDIEGSEMIAEDEVRDHNFSKSSAEFNPKTKVRAGVKLRLSLITDPEVKDPYFHQPLPIDYTAMYNKLVNILVDMPMTYDENGKVEDHFSKIIDRLELFQDQVKYLSTFVDFLKRVNSIEVDTNTVKGLSVFNFKASIVSAFNLQRNNYASRVMTTEEIELSKAKLELQNGRMVKVQDAVYGENITYSSINVSNAIEQHGDVINNWEVAFKNYLNMPEDNTMFHNAAVPQDIFESLQEVRRVTTQIAENKELDGIQKLDLLVSEVFNKVGMNLNPNVIEYYLNNNKPILAPVMDRQANADKLVAQTLLALTPLIENYRLGNDLFPYSSFTMLAKAQSMFNFDSSESSVYGGGKTTYLFSVPSYLHNKVSSWKNRRESFKEFQSKIGAWAKRSVFADHFLAKDKPNTLQDETSLERIGRFEIQHAYTYQDSTNPNSKKTADVKSSKEVSMSTYVKMVVNGLLAKKSGDVNAVTQMRTTTPAGKSTQYDMFHDYFKESGVISNNGNVIRAKATVDTLFNYYTGELERMLEGYDYIKSGKPLKMYYHTSGNKIRSGENNDSGLYLGNAFKSQLFPELSPGTFHDHILTRTEDGVSYPLFEDGVLIKDRLEAYTPAIRQYMTGEVSKNIENTINELKEHSIVEQITENKYQNKGIDSRVWKHYSDEHGTISKDNLNRLAGDIFINGLINHVEYSKLFSGDVAYYKNPVDYIKRIGASYTDGLYQYITNSTGSFNVGIINSIMAHDKYQSEMAELYADNSSLQEAWSDKANIADAQAWITLNRWKDIMLGLGKFTPQAQIAYNKINGGNVEALTAAELKLVAQPLKGVYFDMLDDGTPVFLKYSQAVLIPGVVNANSKLNEMLEFMNHHKLDELITADGIKAGSFTPTSLNNEDGTLNAKDGNNWKDISTLKLKSTGWKLQQDLPIKNVKETDIGSQIIKNMMMLVSSHHSVDPNKKVFDFNGQEYTAEELLKELDSTFGDLINDAFRDLLNEFSIDPSTYEILDKTKFNNAIARQLEDKSVSEHTIKALKAGLSTVALSGVKHKADSVFSNILKDRLVKVKTNGGSFIQMSNFAISKEEADDKYKGEDRVIWSPNVGKVYDPTTETWSFEKGHQNKPYTFAKDENGDQLYSESGKPLINPNQILLSGSFIAKYIPDYQKYSAEELFGFTNDKGVFVKGLIDPKILNTIIGYRIPNQGASSNDSLQIVGILPPGMGDVVVAFSGITTKTGSDFDIDKMYMMFPHFNVRPRFSKKDSKNLIFDYLQENVRGNSLQETVDNLNDLIDKLNPSYVLDKGHELMLDLFKLSKMSTAELLKEDLKSAYNALYDIILTAKPTEDVEHLRESLNLNDVAFEYISSDTDSSKGRQNKIIEIYKTLILNEKNIQQVLTPLDHVHIKDDALNMSKKDSKLSMSTFDLFEDIKTKYSFLAGLAGVGQEANAFSDYAMGTMANILLEGVNVGTRGYQVTQGEDTYTKFDNQLSMELSDAELKQWVDSYNDNVDNPKKRIKFEDIVNKYKSIPISNTLSAIMNAFVDIAKDPYITKVNWNMMTTNVGNMLMRAGVHPFVTMSFMAQPIIAEYIEYVNTYESKSKDSQVRNTKDAFIQSKIRKEILDSGETFQIGSHFTNNENITLGMVELYDAFYEAKKTSREGVLYSNISIDPEFQKFLQSKYGLRNLSEKDIQTLTTFEDKIKNVVNAWSDENNSNKNEPSITKPLGLLRRNVFKPDNAFQREVFKDFLKYTGYAKKLNYSVKASLHGSNGYGKNATSALIALNKIRNLKGKGVLNYESKMQFEDGSLKLLGHHYDKLKKVILMYEANPTLFPEASTSIRSAYNEISQEIEGMYLENEELGDKLDSFLLKYLMSSFEPLSMTRQEKDHLISNFNNEFSAFKTKYQHRYPIIAELSVNYLGTKGVVGLANKTNDAYYIDKLKNSMLQLLEEHPEMGKKLVQYSYLTSGFQATKFSFHQYIPESYFIKNGFNSHIRKFSNSVSIRDFKTQFYLSHLNDNKITKTVSLNALKPLKGYPNSGVVELAKTSSSDLATPFIKARGYAEDSEGTKVAFDKFFIKIGETYESSIYTPYIKEGSNFKEISPLSEELMRGISTSYINSNGKELKNYTQAINLNLENVNKAFADLAENDYISEKVELLDDYGQPVVINRASSELQEDVQDRYTKTKEFKKVDRRTDVERMRMENKQMPQVGDEITVSFEISGETTRSTVKINSIRKNEKYQVHEVELENVKSNKIYKVLIDDNGTVTHKFSDNQGRYMPSTQVAIESFQNLNNVGIKSNEAINGQVSEISSEIYNKLGEKTVSENIEIRQWKDLMYQSSPLLKVNDAIVSVIATRITSSNFHFGNPFSNEKDVLARNSSLIETNSTRESVERYINWILTGELSENVPVTISPEELDIRREWILDQLKSGMLKDKPILYYKELNQPSHATALDYLINKFDWNNFENSLQNEQVTPYYEGDIKPETINETVPQDIPFEIVENSQNKEVENLTESYTYKGVTIGTAFKLTAEQKNALDHLVDFVENGKMKTITLAGYAGTGKTTMIKYLEKYFDEKGDYINFDYAAPTHAAAAYLSLSTLSLANTVASISYEAFNPKTGKVEVTLTNKGNTINDRGGILVVDEFSMLEDKMLENLEKSLTNVKIIYMGDSAQLPSPAGAKINDTTKEVYKEISEKFNSANSLKLTEVKRVEDGDILQVLTELRSNPKGILPVVPETQNLKYYDFGADFQKSAISEMMKNPERTVFIAYSNRAVAEFNKAFRAKNGMSGGIKKGEQILGYGGYNTKTVENRNLGNSIKYTVTSSELNGSMIDIEFKSDILRKLKNEGILLSDTGVTRYIQLSKNDSIVDERVTDEMILQNRKIVASKLKEISDAKKQALVTKSLWANYYNTVREVGMFFAQHDLGNNYIYNYFEDKIEPYDANNPKHKEIIKYDKALVVEKGIDFGYAMTIHKSQGSTHENVFMDASFRPNDTNVYSNKEFVGTEGNALLYVGLSRASKNLHVLKGGRIKNLTTSKTELENIPFDLVNNYMTGLHGAFAQEIWESMTPQQKQQIYKNCI